MANFQPNPAFGGGYYPPQYPSQNPQMSPYNVMAQQQFMQPQHRPPPMYNQMHPSGPHVFQNNAGSFAHNNQYHPHSAHPNTQVPHPQQFFGNGQFPQFPSNLPPPPFPPQPLPQGNQNYHTGMGSNQSSSFGASTAPSHPQFSPFSKEPFPNNGYGYAPTAPNIGHVSDFQVDIPKDDAESVSNGAGKNATASVVSHSAQTSPNLVSVSAVVPAAQNSPTRAQAIQSVHEAQEIQNANAPVPQALLRDGTGTTDKVPSPRSQSKQTGFVAGSPKIAVGTTAHSPAIADAHSTIDELPVAMVSESEVASKRERAKAALLELRDNDIGLQQLVEENIDADILKKLYKELGIPTEDSKPAEPVTLHDSPALNTAEREIKVQGGTLPGLSVATSESEKKTPDNVSDSSLEPGEVDENGKLSQTTVDTKVKSAAPISTSESQYKSKTSPANTKSPSVAPQKKPVERQTYIERLRAAQKSIQKTGEKATPPQASIIEPQSPAVPSVETSKLATITQESHTPADSKKPEFKESAQTQLVRQKLEALKNSSKSAKTVSAQPGTQQEHAAGIELPETAVNMATTEPQEPQQAAIAAEQRYTPTLPFFASSGRTPFGILPGLSPVSSTLPGMTEAVPDGQQADNAPGQSTESVPATSVEEHQISTSIPTEKTVTSRKRATAMDFIDSPPRQTRRRLGSNEPISIVIEVSDDDYSNDNDTEPEMQDDMQQTSSLSGMRTSDARKELRSLPPLTSAPSRGSASSAANTPPISQTPQVLVAAHEENIKVMRQRIQEYELKQRVKRALAVKQPATLAVKPADIGTSLAIAELKEDKGDELSAINQQLVEQKTSLGAIDAAVSVAEEKLQAEEQAQAMIVARAETERQGAATANSLAEKQDRLDRKSALEAALPKLDSQIQTARSRLEDIQQQKRGLELEIEQITEGRNSLLEELRTLLVAESDFRSGAPVLASPVQPSALAAAATDVQEQDIPTKSITQDVLTDQGVDEKSVSDSSNPDVKEMQPAQIETLEDIMDISSSDEGQIISSYASPSNASITREPPAQPQASALHNPRSEDSAQGSSSNPEDMYDAGYEHIENGARVSTSTVQGDVDEDDGSVIGEYEPEAPLADAARVNLEDSTMTDNEEYEPSDEPGDANAPPSGQNFTANLHDSRMSGSQVYEPSNGQLAPNALNHRQSSEQQIVEAAMSEADDYEPEFDDVPTQPARDAPDAPISIASSSDDESVSMESEVSGYSDTQIQNMEGNVNETAQSPKGRHFSDDQPEEGEVSDEAFGNSDYEPPEPSFAVDNLVAISSTRVAADLHSDDSESNEPEFLEDAASEIPSAHNDSDAEENGQTNGDTIQGNGVTSYGHYTPYESPLNQFSSYRFHPQYVSEVQGGFRSLTYSHKIDHSKPLCKWELAGGICNDSSCTEQHFRDLTPSGSAILIDMIGIREGRTEEERQEYVSGLKRAINEMQKKNMNDVDSVAAEIVAYRRRFLGDSSRVVTNLEEEKAS